MNYTVTLHRETDKIGDTRTYSNVWANSQQEAIENVYKHRPTLSMVLYPKDKATVKQQ